jgi:hypothetical protein
VSGVRCGHDADLYTAEGPRDGVDRPSRSRVLRREGLVRQAATNSLFQGLLADAWGDRADDADARSGLR